MRVIRWLAIALALVVVAGVLWGLRPPKPLDIAAGFEPRKFGEGIDVYLESVESHFDDIRPDQQKRVVWAGQRETRTPVSVVYLHGFSASSEEIRPVPDRVAEALGANLVYTRFAGHGRLDPDAMADSSVRAWMADAAEALALGRATGERVLVISTSTGGTIMAEAATVPEMVADVSGIVFVSPNFGVNNALAPLLTAPGARYWLPLIVGQRRTFEPRNPGQATGWTTDYPSAAVFPMAELVRDAVRRDYSQVQIPALFYFSDADQVVRPQITHEIAERWGGPVTIAAPDLGPNVDPLAHVIAGDIISPGNTDAAVTLIVDWARALLP